MFRGTEASILENRFPAAWTMGGWDGDIDAFSLHPSTKREAAPVDFHILIPLNSGNSFKWAQRGKIHMGVQTDWCILAIHARKSCIGKRDGRKGEG